MMDFPDEEVCLAGISGPLSLEDVLFYAAKSNRIAPLQVVRADRVVGADHVRSAALHAHRAAKEGRSHAKTPELEFTRYLAGERQIKSALEKMGIRDGEPTAVVIALGPKRADALQHFINNIGAPIDDTLSDASMEKLTAFGITDTAIKATTPAHRLDLALEAVAAVDLLR